MKLRKFLVLGILGCLALSGCENKIEIDGLLTPLVRNSPTPQPSSSDKKAATATATPVPAATTAPGMTATPSPRRVGIREGSIGSVLISNSSGQRIREIYLQDSDSENWGRNLIPGEASVHVGEVFTLYYPALTSGSSYNLRMRDNDGITYEIYGVDLTDMRNAILRKDDASSVYLSYTSLSDGTQKDTRGSSWSDDQGTGDEDEESQYYDSSAFYPFSNRRLTGTPTPQNSGDSDEDEDEEYWDYIGDGTDAWDSYDYDDEDYDYDYDYDEDEYYGIPYGTDWDYQSQY